MVCVCHTRCTLKRAQKQTINFPCTLYVSSNSRTLCGDNTHLVDTVEAAFDPSLEERGDRLTVIPEHGQVEGGVLILQQTKKKEVNVKTQISTQGASKINTSANTDIMRPPASQQHRSISE